MGLTPFGILTLTSLGFIWVFIPSKCALKALTLLACIVFKPYLCLLTKHIFLRNLGLISLRDSYLCDQGFLIFFLCHFQDWLCVFLGIGHVCTKAHGSWSSWWTRRVKISMYFREGVLINSFIFCLSEKFLFCYFLKRYFCWVKIFVITIFQLMCFKDVAPLFSCLHYFQQVTCCCFLFYCT